MESSNTEFNRQLSKLHMLGFKEDSAYNTNTGKLLTNNNSAILILDAGGNGAHIHDLKDMVEADRKDTGLNIIHNRYFVIVIVDTGVMATVNRLDVYSLESGQKIDVPSGNKFYKDIVTNYPSDTYLSQVGEMCTFINEKVILLDISTNIVAVNTKGKTLSINGFIRFGMPSTSEDSKFKNILFRSLIDTSCAHWKLLTKRDISGVHLTYANLSGYKAISHQNTAYLRSISDKYKDRTLYLLGYATCGIPSVLMPAYVIDEDLNIIHDIEYGELKQYIGNELNSAPIVGISSIYKL